MANVDLRIQHIEAMASPAEVFARFPLDKDGSKAIASYRQTIAKIIRGEDSRLLAIVGPLFDPRSEGGAGVCTEARRLRQEVEDRCSS